MISGRYIDALELGGLHCLTQRKLFDRSWLGFAITGIQSLILKVEGLLNVD